MVCSSSVGGLVGCNAGIIANCHADVKITAKSHIGGIAGHSINSSDERICLITNCYANVDIVAEYCVGGIVGSNFARVSCCYSIGKLKGETAVGGLAGINEKYSSDYILTVSVTDSYSLCRIEGDRYVGGLIGGNQETISKCYSAGLVTGLSDVGGLVGKAVNKDLVKDNYWDIEKSNTTTSDGGIGKTTSDMKSKDTYKDWDFSFVWNISSTENNGYPVLRVNEYVREIKNSMPNLRSDVQSSVSASVTANSPYRINLNDIFIDSDNDNMTYKVSVNGGSYVVVNSVYTYTPSSFGETVLVFKANDGQSDSEDSYTVYLSVDEPKNNIPTLRSDVQSSVKVNIYVGTPYEINLGNVFTDSDNDNITFKVSVGSREYLITNSSYYSYIPESKGEIALVFRANDGKKDSNDVYTVILSVIEPVMQKYTLSISSTVGGVVIANTNNNYAQGDIVNLTAKPSSGYVFIKWNSIGGGRFSSESDKEITFTMPGNNVVVNAEFEIINPVMKPAANKYNAKDFNNFIKQLF